MSQPPLEGFIDGYNGIERKLISLWLKHKRPRRIVYYLGRYDGQKARKKFDKTLEAVNEFLDNT